MNNDYERAKRLLNEALWYINWSLAFSVVIIIVFFISSVEGFRNNDARAITLAVLGWAILLFSKYLSAKSHQYHRKAAEVVDDRH